MIDLISLIISIMSMLIAIVFSFVAMKAQRIANNLSTNANKLARASIELSDRANDLSESQKTAAIISLMAPASESSEVWKLFIEYLIDKDKLPYFNESDREFIEKLMGTLNIKCELVSGKIKLLK